MEQTHELIALIDLDGTVADFDRQMKKDLAGLQSPEEGTTLVVGPNDEDEPSWLAARKKLIRSIPGWWEHLPVYSPGMEIVQILRDAKFSLMVLTKGPFKNPLSWTEKVLWCRKNLPDAAVTITEDKGLVYGKVLVDDWPAYGIRWLQWRPRGLLIVPAHPWNTLDRYPSHLHDNIYRYTGTTKQRSEILSRLQAIKNATR